MSNVKDFWQEPTYAELLLSMQKRVHDYVVADVGTAQEALDKLTAASRKVIASAEYRKFAADKGYSVENMTPQEIRAEFEQDHAMFTELLKFLEQK